MDLIVNPLAAVERMPETGDLITGGPVPGRGMKFLEISSGDRPHLYRLFTELSSTGLGSLDIVADLRDGDIELLHDHGVLIESDRVPERPLFACQLVDVEPADYTPGSPIVNPTLEFQPFDLTKFRSWMQDKHLSPHQPTVWVTDPRTGARWGYWLTGGEADAVSRLEPGASAGEDLEPALMARLTAASILIDPSTGAAGEFEKAARKFAEERYAVVTDAVPPAQVRALRAYMRRYVEQGFMRFGDTQVERRFAAHGEAVASMFHEALMPLMQTIVGVPIRRTYAYSAVYEEGAELVPHTDRELCEFSYSFQLDYEPEPADGVSPWALYLAPNRRGDLKVDPAQDVSVHLPSGGLLIYKGREIVHYRTPLPAGHRSTSIFFHYVPE